MRIKGDSPLGIHADSAPRFPLPKHPEGPQGTLPHSGLLFGSSPIDALSTRPVARGSPLEDLNSPSPKNISGSKNEAREEVRWPSKSPKTDLNLQGPNAGWASSKDLHLDPLGAAALGPGREGRGGLLLGPLSCWLTYHRRGLAAQILLRCEQHPNQAREHRGRAPGGLPPPWPLRRDSGPPPGWAAEQRGAAHRPLSPSLLAGSAAPGRTLAALSG